MALRRIAESRNRQRGKDDVIQEFGTVYPVPIGLGENVRAASANALNQLLADTMVLRDLYKKHHWQVSGATFYQLHLIFDKHYREQVELMDELAELITALGGVPLAAPHDVVETSSIPAPAEGTGISAGATLATARCARANPHRISQSGERSEPE
jgi:starvation-inducible DNA-binding protein